MTRCRLLFIAVLATSCGSSPSAPTPPVPSPSPSPPGSFTLTGRVVGTVSGLPIAGATVTVGGQTFTTDTDGAFTLTDGAESVRDVVVTGKVSNWTYEAGVYSNQVDKEFGQFDGGWSTTVGFGYDFKKVLDVERADWRFDWLHSEIDDADTLQNRWSEGFNTGIVLQDGRLGLTAETFIFSGNSDDAWGFFIQPTFDVILKKLQLVARYSFSDGDGADNR